ncbi:chaplin ChpF [Streptomyces albiaxialis]|uniref:Chaplin ChpF n=1 Tax=Streptomyces albiaxialis TaxID=329523 RepID=A0ABP5HFA9_9ACTN
MKYTKVATVAAGTLIALGSAAAPALADAGASGASANSPGVISGNTIQVPIHLPVNLCGNTIDIIGLLNPAFGNVCVNR